MVAACDLLFAQYTRNDYVRQKREQPHLSATVQARHLSLLSRTVRMPDESDAKQILSASPLEYWRPLGRPRTTWMKTIQQDLESLNLFLDDEAIDVAQNRPLWRMMSTFGATHS